VKSKSTINIKNKKAYYLYEIIETYTAGIQLLGTEIKSIRESKISFTDSYCVFIDNELWVKGLHISEYSHASHYNHEAKRQRKLLLTKKELKKLQKKIKEKGFTIIPLRIFINENGFAKLDIGLARGKRIFDKREDLKSKDNKRDLSRFNKQRHL